VRFFNCLLLYLKKCQAECFKIFSRLIFYDLRFAQRDIGGRFLNCLLLYLKNCQADSVKILSTLRSYICLNHAKIKLALFCLLVIGGNIFKKRFFFWKFLASSEF